MGGFPKVAVLQQPAASARASLRLFFSLALHGHMHTQYASMNTALGFKLLTENKNQNPGILAAKCVHALCVHKLLLFCWSARLSTAAHLLAAHPLHQIQTSCICEHGALLSVGCSLCHQIQTSCQATLSRLIHNCLTETNVTHARSMNSAPRDLRVAPTRYRTERVAIQNMHMNNFPSDNNSAAISQIARWALALFVSKLQRAEHKQMWNNKGMTSCKAQHRYQ